MLYPHDVPAVLNASSVLSPHNELGCRDHIPFNSKEISGYQDLHVPEVTHWVRVELGSHSRSVCLQTPRPPHYGKLPL